jgi:acyl phosphate:glycerol-3-phosphate acyltransferase
MVLWSLVGYLSGSIPFSFLLGKYFARKDIRQIGDGNPGGTNAWKAGGWPVGLLSIALDIFKGYLSVALARQAGVEGWALIPVCLAPILGHATTPFLGFRGGKALGPAGGAWAALIGLWVFGIFTLFSLTALVLIKKHAWSSLIGVSSLIFWSIFVDGSTWMIVLAISTLLLITWTHRRDLALRPRLPLWMTRLFYRGKSG